MPAEADVVMAESTSGEGVNYGARSLRAKAAIGLPALAFLVAICGAGALSARAVDPAPPSIHDELKAPASPPIEPAEPAIAPGRDSVAAIVNGEPISREKYLGALEKQYGAEVLDQLVNTALLRQEAERCGAAQNEKLEAEIRQRAQQEVDAVLLQRARVQGLASIEELERNYERAGGRESFAALRDRLAQEARLFAEPQVLADKILAQRIQVTDEQIAAEFASRYGPKVIVRQIVVRTRADAEAVLTKLKSGADFSALALEMSVDPVSGTRGGLMEPLPNQGPLGAAFALKENETSDIIRTEEGFHVLKMVRSIPARNAKLEDVKEELRQQVMQTETRKRIPELLAELRAKSKIETNLK